MAFFMRYVNENIYFRQVNDQFMIQGVQAQSVTSPQHVVEYLKSLDSSKIKGMPDLDDPQFFSTILEETA